MSAPVLPVTAPQLRVKPGEPVLNGNEVEALVARPQARCGCQRGRGQEVRFDIPDAEPEQMPILDESQHLVISRDGRLREVVEQTQNLAASREMAERAFRRGSAKERSRRRGRYARWMSLSPRSRRIQVVPFIVGSVLLLAGLWMGFLPVSGTFDSESFRCGSPFVAAADDGGYGGTEQYEACDRERRHFRWPAVGSLVLGIGLFAGTASFASVGSSGPGRG